MTEADELFSIADSLETQGKLLHNEKFSSPLQILTDAAEKIGKAWSGSWLGYHSRVYYAGLTEPPPQAYFSQESGLRGPLIVQNPTVGDWKEYRFNCIVSSIMNRVQEEIMERIKKHSSSAMENFDEAKSRILSLLSVISDMRRNDNYLRDTIEKVKEVKVFDADYFIRVKQPSCGIISSDKPALQDGLCVPPHLSVLALVDGIRHPFIACEELSKLSRRIALHIQNVERHKAQSERVGTKVFIGHGQSSLWKDLKDFVQDRMYLPWDEFNRVPVAGITNTVRLSQMLDGAAIAFLIMTAEDEQADGKQRARQNVIHEAGLFQGRLGFERAIILLEEGCEEFSNIQGLGQIRFPNGNISAIFEEIRKVLEREGLVGKK